MLKDIASKDDVAALLRDFRPQKDQITDVRNDARMHCLRKVGEIRILCKLLIKQGNRMDKELGATQKEVNALIGKAAAQDENSASQKSPETPEEPLKSLTIRVAILRARSAEFKEIWNVLMKQMSALPLDDLRHAAGAEHEIVTEVGALLDESAKSDEDAENTSRISASRSSDTSARGSGMGQSMASEGLANGNPGVGPSTSRQ